MINIRDPRERFIVARWAYLVGQPIMSDPEYDDLERFMKDNFPLDPYCNRPWSFDECPKDLLNKYGYSSMIIDTVMGYNAESIKSINTREDYEATFSSLNERSRVSFKIDGWNTRASYYNGHIIKFETRGRSGNNLDMSGLPVGIPKKIPIKGRVYVKGETSIPNNLWPSYKQLTGNSDQRSSVRTAMARGDFQFLSFLSFAIHAEDGLPPEYDNPDTYVTLSKLGFKTPTRRFVNDFASLDKCLDYMSALDKGYGYLTDGLVIENSRIQLAIRLGAWQEVAMASYVTGYEESQGMYGVAMNADIYPITIGGKTYPTVSVVNLGAIIENNLQIGAPIAFRLRSSANVVLDATTTYQLQQQWADRFDEYREYIENKNS